MLIITHLFSSELPKLTDDTTAEPSPLRKQAKNQNCANNTHQSGHKMPLDSNNLRPKDAHRANHLSMRNPSSDANRRIGIMRRSCGWWGALTILLGEAAGMWGLFPVKSNYDTKTVF